MLKIAFFDTKPYDIPGFEKYGNIHNIQFKYYETRLNLDTAGLAAGSDGVCVFVNDILSEEVICRLASLGVKLIALRCAGFNNIDLAAAQGRVCVTRVPSYSPHAVAEHAMAMLLTLLRKTHKAYLRTRDFNFSLSGLVGTELHGKTVGIVGTGRIGHAFSDICFGFGMRILAYDAHPSNTQKMEYTSLEHLLTESDVISLHCPLTQETRHMIDKTASKK